VIGILAGLLLPVLGRSKAMGRRAQCINNLRQMAMAAQLYWDENGGSAFRYRRGTTNGGDTYWFGWLASGPEGTRVFDPAMGALFPYLGGVPITVCPSLNYRATSYKFKAMGAAYGYGYNVHLSTPGNEPPFNMNQLRTACNTVVFADAAQVNTFQPPASPQNPMLEEFYYVSAHESTVHFRHDGYALAGFCDGHVAAEKPAPSSLDARLPGQSIGRLRHDLLWPR
jgi:prepilin-type processing-associated H-X9-DG protein